MTTTNESYDEIRIAIANGSYNDLDEALCAIDEAFSYGEISQREARLLEAQAEAEF